MLLLVAPVGVITLLIYLLIFLIILGVVYWLVTTLAPEPIRRFAVAIVVVLAAIFLIWFLLQLVGAVPPRLE